MISKGKIGVIIPAVLDRIDSELLDGIYTKSKEHGYDTLVFTNASNLQEDQPHTDYIIGEEKIYTLAANVDVDGFILAAGRFKNQELVQNILSALKKTNTPCVVLSCLNDDSLCTVVSELFELITGKNDENIKIKNSTENVIKNCGCHTDSHKEMPEELFSQHMESRESFLTSDFISRLSDVSTIEEYIRTVDSIAFLMPKWKHMSLCICQDWQGDFENTDKPENENYSENMLMMLSKSRTDVKYETVAFPTANLLPSLIKKHTSKFIVFLPLHYGRQALGYCAMEYEDGSSYIMEERCKIWCDSVSNGLISLRNKFYTNFIRRKNEEYSYFDTITGILSLKGLMHVFPIFLKQAEKIDKCVQVIVLSCRSTCTSDLKVGAYNLWTLVANAIQMSCSDSESAARINEGYFIIIRVLTDESERKRWSEEKILQIIRMVKSIQSQLKTLKVPDFVYEYGEVFPNKTSLDNIMTEMITRLNEKRFCKRISDYAAVLAELRLEIRVNPQFDWNSDSIADEYGISKGYFMKLYKAQFGITFTDDLINVRLDKARNLLKSTNMRLAEIADNCGYNNIYHFMRQFKKKFGVTAMNYRNNL